MEKRREGGRQEWREEGKEGREGEREEERIIE